MRIGAVIDGHSHEEPPGLVIKSKDGKDVVIAQTGTKLANIGKMTISSDGTISTGLVSSVPASEEDGIAEDSWIEPDGREGIFVDEAVNSVMMQIASEYGDILDEKIGTSSYDLITNDPETGGRHVRNHETNLGDLCADAYRFVLDAEVSIVNGGDGWIFTGKCSIIRDNVMPDSDHIAVYIRDNLGGIIPDKYSNPYGEGRIKISVGAAFSDDVQSGGDDTAAENPATGTETPVMLAFVSLAVAIISGKYISAKQRK